MAFFLPTLIIDALLLDKPVIYTCGSKQYHKYYTVTFDLSGKPKTWRETWDFVWVFLKLNCNMMNWWHIFHMTINSGQHLLSKTLLQLQK